MTNKSSSALSISLTLAPDQLAVLVAAVSEQMQLSSTSKVGGIPEKYLVDSECDKAAIEEVFAEVVENIGKKEGKALLKAFGAKKVKGIEEEHYKDFWVSAKEMLAEFSGDNDDDEETEENESEIDSDALKKAIQKIASKDKEGASAILKAAGLNTVRGMAKADDIILTKLFKGVKKYNK